MTVLKVMIALLGWEISKAVGNWLYQKLFYKRVVVQIDPKSKFTLSVRRGGKVDIQALAVQLKDIIGEQ